MKSFCDLQLLPTDSIFQLMAEYAQNLNPKKINLGIGVYRDADGVPFVFKSIQKAAKNIQTENFEYISIQGRKLFLDEVVRLVLGEKYMKTTAVQQTLGGTHALRMVADFFETGKVLIGIPTWSNHLNIFRQFEVLTFPHITDQKSFDLESYQKNIQSNPGSILILHGGATHNPTGVNISKNQLDEVIELANNNQIFTLIDAAYLGFGEGIRKDVAWVRYIFEKLEKTAIAISFSKNASLYNQRLGVLCWKAKEESQKCILESHLQQMVRTTISNLPDFGASIMTEVFTNKNLRNAWLEDLEKVRMDINFRRKKLISLLPDRFGFLKNTKGLFGISDMNPGQVEFLKREYSIYMPSNGRINFASLRNQDFSILKKAFNMAYLKSGK